MRRRWSITAGAYARPVDDATPQWQVDARSALSKARAEGRKSGEWGKDKRRTAAKVHAKLSRPHDAAAVNELKTVSDKPPEERAQHMMEWGEDMEF